MWAGWFWGGKRGHRQERQAVTTRPRPPKTHTRTHLDEVGVLAVAADDKLVDLSLHAELLQLIGRRHVPLGQPRLALPVLEQQEADLWPGWWALGHRGGPVGLGGGIGDGSISQSIDPPINGLHPSAASRACKLVGSIYQSHAIDS